MAEVNHFPGTIAVGVYDVKTGQRWTLNAKEKFHAASTVKVPVALYAWDQHRKGLLGWQDQIEYTAADYESPGAGSFEETSFGTKFTVEDLVSRSLQNSNNVAVNMLGRVLGWHHIRDWSKTIDAELFRGDDASPQATVTSELGWWIHLERIAKEDPRNAEKLLGPLRAATDRGRITAGLPQGVPHLHKFGSLAPNFHDTGLVYGKRPYILVVLTNGASRDQADLAIARISAGVYAAMNDK